MEKKYKCNFVNFKMDEFFVYEYNKCPYRAFSNSKEIIVKSYSSRNKKVNSIKTRKYVPYGEMLEYSILKKIYYKAFQLIKINGKLDFDTYKKMAITIIEKELLENAKRMFKDYDYQMSIKEKIYKELECHFALLLEDDIEDSISSFVTVKADLRKYLTYRVSTLNKKYLSTLSLIDWDEVEGDPLFILDFINLQKSREGLNLVITAPLRIHEKLVHRHYYFSLIIQYMFYFYPKEELRKFFNNKELIHINKLIVYFPLMKERKEFVFENINGVFNEYDLIKILRIWLEGLHVKTTNNDDCELCEQARVCFHRTNCQNYKGRRKIFQSIKRVKEIIL